jgi:hypothetical protein
MKKVAIIFLIMGVSMQLLGMGMYYGVISNSHFHSGEYIELDKATGLMVFSFFGLIFIAIGGAIFHQWARKIKQRNLLLSSGQKIRATIAAIHYEKKFYIYLPVVECVADVDGKEHRFKSNRIWHDIRFQIGQEIAVYVDTRNHNSYWVEVGE